MYKYRAPPQSDVMLGHSSMAPAKGKIKGLVG